MEKVRLPETGEVITERRRVDDRRSGLRRSDDMDRRPIALTQAALWAVVGGIVCLYLLLILVNAVDPKDAKAATVIVLVLAVAWLVHAWRRLYLGGFSPRPDRERRGF